MRSYATTYGALLGWLDWWVEARGPIVELERIEVYGKSSYHILVGTVEVVVGHAPGRQRRPGRKTDKVDAGWMAELLAHGRIRPRVVPPPTISALCDLTGTHVALIQTPSQAKHRVSKPLGSTSAMSSDLTGGRVDRTLLGRPGVSPSNLRTPGRSRLLIG